MKIKVRKLLICLENKYPSTHEMNTIMREFYPEEKKDIRLLTNIYDIGVVKNLTEGGVTQEKIDEAIKKVSEESYYSDDVIRMGLCAWIEGYEAVAKLPKEHLELSKKLEFGIDTADAEEKFRIGKLLHETSLRWLKSSADEENINASVYIENNYAPLLDYENLQLDDIIEFGRWKKDSEEDIKPIKWQILEIKEDKILLLSKYLIQPIAYDKNNADWEHSDLRKWANSDFYNSAFTFEEQNKIERTLVINNVGNDTSDKVFILSQDEIKNYMPKYFDRICKITTYSSKNKASHSDRFSGYWWCRSQYSDDCMIGVGADGSFTNLAKKNGVYCVRAAMWLRIKD